MYPGTRSNPIIIEGRTKTATSLLGKVLLISSMGFFVSGVGVWLAPLYYSQGVFWLCVISSFLLIFAIRATRSTPTLSLGLFLLLTLVMGFEIAPWIQHLLHTGRMDVVFNAALTTAVGMGTLGLVAQIVSFNYRKVGNYALAALLGLIIVGVLSAFFHFLSPGFYSWATLAIFSVLIVVDFARIRNGGDGATAVELALSIYLDGLNVFLALTRIFSGGRRN
jgi:modulator of FtsH protease